MPTLREAIGVMHRAGPCNDCFVADSSLHRGLCNLPQPRWIGPGYFHAKRKVAIVLINPGGGGTSADSAALRHQVDLFRAFYQSGDYEPISHYFQERLQLGDQWMTWYRDKLALDYDEIAQLNIAWCATRGDRYPTTMLKHCFDKHTSPLLRCLDPDVVLLSGSSIRSFEALVRRVLPEAQVVSMLHYAHRKSYQEEREDAERVIRVICRKEDLTKSFSTLPNSRQEAADPWQFTFGSPTAQSPNRWHPSGDRRLSMTDPRITIQLLDELVSLGFNNSAFARLHHHRIKGANAGIADHRTYCEKHRSFRAGDTNELVQKRLKLVLTKDGALPPQLQNPRLFVDLAETAWAEIPPR